MADKGASRQQTTRQWMARGSSEGRWVLPGRQIPVDADRQQSMTRYGPGPGPDPQQITHMGIHGRLVIYGSHPSSLAQVDVDAHVDELHILHSSSVSQSVLLREMYMSSDFQMHVIQVD